MKVCFFDEGHGLAIGEGGIVVCTEDGGRRWEDCSVDIMGILPEDLQDRGVTAINFYDVCVRGESEAWIVGDSGIVVHSATGGDSWEVLRIGAYSTLFSVYFRDGEEGYAVGQRGVLLHTEDGGKSWEGIESGTEENLYQITMSGEDGAIVGENGTVLVSRDGGKSWGQLEGGFMIPPPSLVAAAIVGPNSETKGLIVAGDNTVKAISLGK